MTDQATPAAGAPDGGASPAPSRTDSPAPAARVGQAERDAQGQNRWNSPRDHIDERAQWEQQQRDRHKPAAQQAKPDQGAKPADGAADKTLKVGQTSITESELQEYLAQKGALSSDRSRAPETPEGYALDLPADFKAPLGVEIALDKADPALAQLRGLAHKYQMPQEAVSDLLGLFVGHKAGELALGKLAYEAEVGKLGPAGPARIDSLATWLRGQIGDQSRVLTGVRDATGAVRGGTLWSADVVKAYESLMNKVRGGGGGYRANGSDMGGQNEGKIAGYEKMDFAQRRQAQDQLAARQRGR